MLFEAFVTDIHTFMYLIFFFKTFFFFNLNAYFSLLALSSAIKFVKYAWKLVTTKMQQISP